VGVILCAGKISRYMERECNREFGREKFEYKIVGKFLADLKKKFGKEDNKTMKVTELKRIEKESREMEEFIQEFIRVARGSGYEERPLVKEFKRGMNGVIRRKLMKAEHFQKV